MERQRCVINAVVEQTTPETVLANFQAIAKAGEETITTDVPRSLLPDLVDLGLKVKDTSLRSIVFDPDTGFSSPDPDWPEVRKKVQKALAETAAQNEASATPTPTATGSASPSSTASPSKTPKASSKATRSSQDLDKLCAYNPEKS